MRIDVDLDDAHRDAIKAYADAHNLRMRGAYAKLLRHALWSRTRLKYQPENRSIGVEWIGSGSRLRTNIGFDRFIQTLKNNPGEWLHLYMPRHFALEAVWGDELDVEPSIFDMDTTDPSPKEAGGA